MIHYILTFFMGVAVGALLLIRSYEKDNKKPRLRVPQTQIADDDQTEDETTSFTQQQQADAPVATDEMTQATEHDAEQEPQVFSVAENKQIPDNQSEITQPTSSLSSELSSELSSGSLQDASAASERSAAVADSQQSVTSAESVAAQTKEDAPAAEATNTRTVGGLVAAAQRVLDEQQLAEQAARSADQQSASVKAVRAEESYEDTSQQGAADSQQQPSTSSADADQTETTTAPDVITLHLKAPSKLPYQGYELLQALLSLGLRFGKRKIFHRFQNMHANKKIIFSVALSYSPGTFELERMGGQRYRSLAFFMAEPLGLYNIIAFEKMLQTAKSLQEELGGDLLDSKGLPLSTSTLAAWRSQLREKSSEDDIMPVTTEDMQPSADDDSK